MFLTKVWIGFNSWSSQAVDSKSCGEKRCREGRNRTILLWLQLSSKHFPNVTVSLHANPEGIQVSLSFFNWTGHSNPTYYCIRNQKRKRKGLFSFYIQVYGTHIWSFRLVSKCHAQTSTHSSILIPLHHHHQKSPKTKQNKNTPNPK